MESPITAKAALLQALLRGPGFGLDLITRVKDLTLGTVELGQGSVYPALRDLERGGLLESHEEPPSERGGRPRRYFKLTNAGEKAALEQRRVVLSIFGAPDYMVPERAQKSPQPRRRAR